jgi:hypothetical protein
MAFSAWGMRRWLMKHPKPVLLRLTKGDTSDDLPIKKGMSYSRLGETITAKNPDLLEAFDAEGSLLRAVRPQLDAEPSDAPSVPDTLKNDPETARITHFANLIHRAYEHTTTVAFEKLLELVERMDARSDAIERRLERTEANYRRAVNDQLNDAFDRVESLEDDEEKPSPGGDLRGLVETFLQGVSQSQGPSPGGNGKAKADA